MVPPILKAAWSSAQRQQQEAEAAAATSAEGGPSEADQQLAMEEPLSWLPPTYAAVALRLQALDAALYFAPGARCVLLLRHHHHRSSSWFSCSCGNALACLSQRSTAIDIVLTSLALPRVMQQAVVTVGMHRQLAFIAGEIFPHFFHVLSGTMEINSFASDCALRSRPCHALLASSTPWSEFGTAGKGSDHGATDEQGFATITSSRPLVAFSLGA
eukprot:1157922-Pelagomonas_calceolata.AAC.13